MELPHQNGDLERNLSSEASGLLSPHGSGNLGNTRSERRKQRPTSASSRSSANTLTGGRRRSPKSGCPGSSILDPHEIRSAGSAAVDSVTSIARVLCSGDLDEVSHKVAERLTNIEDRVFFRHDGGGPATPVAREQFNTASVPLLHDVQLELDDKDAAVVLVFPRKPPDSSSSASGLVEIGGEMHVAKPGEMLQKAFLERPEHHCPHAQQIVDASRAGNDQPMLARAYGRIVREEIVNVLADQGFQIKTRESIDKEEVFALVYLPREGAAIRRMARTYSYRLPVNQEAYDHVSLSMPENAWGEKVPAYMSYEEGLQTYLEPFSHRDEVLIAKRRLDELLNFNELKSQHVMTKHFAATKYKDVMHLHRNWSKLRRLCLPPNFDSSRPLTCLGLMSGTSHSDVLNDVRDYYGEEVAFFYMWLARFIRWLMPLAVIGLVALAIRRHPAWAPHISQRQDHQIRLTFACVMVLWASLVNKFWTRVAARMRQQWGLTGEANVQTWSRVGSYDPHADGTWYGVIRSNFSYVCPVIYCSVFIAIVMQVQPHLNDVHSTVQRFLPSVGIFLFGNLWSRLVPYVVDMQNHEMQARWNDALTWFLAPVKLIITVWPFLNLMFVKKWSDSKTFMKDSPEYNAILGGMQEIFKRSDAGCRLIGQNASTLVDFLTQQDYVNWEGKEATFYGCLPVNCWVRHPSKRFETSPCFPETACDLEVRLTTDCLEQLENQLFAFYIMHFSIMLVLVMWPIILARFTMKNAIIKENMKAGMTTRRYSLIQFQAKCFDLAPYEYWSWGGSWVENFMEPAIVFAHLQCFALIAPILSFLAFATLVLEYRLMAYRHNNMTCRNWPYASDGIGAWSFILKCSSYMAVFCIVCKVTLLDDEEKLFDYEFDMAKIEGKIGLDMDKQGDYKLGNFILMQVVMLGIQAGVGLVIPDDPDDVERIGNFNAYVKTRLLREQEVELKQVHASAMGTHVLKSEFVSNAKSGLVAGLDSASEGEDSALSAGPSSCEDSATVSEGASSTEVQESSELVERHGCLFGARALR